MKRGSQWFKIPAKIISIFLVIGIIGVSIQEMAYSQAGAYTIGIIVGNLLWLIPAYYLWIWRIPFRKTGE